MFVLALVLVVVGAAVAVIGLLALSHRLPRNRVVGVRTPWTMSRVDAFRRANRAAGPAFVASGAIGVVGGAGAAAGAGAGAAVGGGATAVTLLAVGTVGLLVLLGAAGVVGVRYAAADEAAEVAASAPSGPCTLDAEPHEEDLPEADACAPSGAPCSGACALCPRADRRG